MKQTDLSIHSITNEININQENYATLPPETTPMAHNNTIAAMVQVKHIAGLMLQKGGQEDNYCMSQWRECSIGGNYSHHYQFLG